jgi:hypothetical protein
MFNKVFLAIIGRYRFLVQVSGREIHLVHENRRLVYQYHDPENPYPAAVQPGIQ